MASFFFDTSALVKRHLTEVGSAWVRSLLVAGAGHRIYIARITAVEVVSAITRRQHGGDLSPAQAGAILGHFRRHLNHRYRVIELTPALLNDAMMMARRHRLRAYDAVQLALAVEVRRVHQILVFEPVTLVSADRELNAAAMAEGLDVIDPIGQRQPSRLEASRNRREPKLDGDLTIPKLSEFPRSVMLVSSPNPSNRPSGRPPSHREAHR